MQTGFVGLGAMGAHMARNLHRAGLLDGRVESHRREGDALAQELHCHAFADLAELAANCEAVVICVSADEDVRAVVAGPRTGLESPHDRDGLLHGGSRQRRATCTPGSRALGVGFLDCPVSGGVEGARAASLAIMVGGDEEVFTRALAGLGEAGQDRHATSVRAARARRRRRPIRSCAPASSKPSAKRWRLRTPKGLPLDRLIDTLGKGAGSSWYFVNRAPFMARNSFPAGFRVRLHAKDLRICRDMAAQQGAHAAGRRIHPAAVCGTDRAGLRR